MNSNKLSIGKVSAEKLIQKFGSPLYVYDAQIIKDKFLELKNSLTYPNTVLHYACKANTNLEILRLLRRLGASMEAVSIGEILAAFKAGFKPQEIIFTCSNLSEDELRFLIDHKILINLDSLSQLEKYGKLNPHSDISIRINQGIGAGHHNHVITGGPESKFGIYPSQIVQAKRIVKKYKLKIVGIHQHIGSNVLDETIFLKAITALLKTAKIFRELKFIDFGGGFGIPYRPDDSKLNLKFLGKKISSTFAKFASDYGKQLVMVFEVGRFLVAESGYLLTMVTDVKITPVKKFVGVDSGFNHLLRPAMYNSYHEIINASNLKASKEIVTVAGNICESGDIFAKNRRIAKSKEGDILAILNTGAYGYSMSSNYNSRPRPAEVLVTKNQIKLIKKREKLI